MAGIFRSRSGSLPVLDQNDSLCCYVDPVLVTKRFGHPRQALPSLVTQGSAFSARRWGMLTLPGGFGASGAIRSCRGGYG